MNDGNQAIKASSAVPECGSQRFPNVPGTAPREPLKGVQRRSNLEGDNGSIDRYSEGRPRAQMGISLPFNIARRPRFRANADVRIAQLNPTFATIDQPHPTPTSSTYHG